MRQTISPHPTPMDFLLAPRIWEPRDQPQPGSFRSERGGVAIGGDKTLAPGYEVVVIEAADRATNNVGFKFINLAEC